jgi:hypothetical protein
LSAPYFLNFLGLGDDHMEEGYTDANELGDELMGEYRQHPQEEQRVTHVNFEDVPRAGLLPDNGRYRAKRFSTGPRGA